MTDEKDVLFSKARTHDMLSLLVLTVMPLQANTMQLGGLLKGQIVQDAAVCLLPLATGIAQTAARDKGLSTISGGHLL